MKKHQREIDLWFRIGSICIGFAAGLFAGIALYISIARFTHKVPNIEGCIFTPIGLFIVAALVSPALVWESHSRI
jgi:hypothetical protein